MRKMTKVERDLQKRIEQAAKRGGDMAKLATALAELSDMILLLGLARPEPDALESPDEAQMQQNPFYAFIVHAVLWREFGDVVMNDLVAIGDRLEEPR